MLLTENGMDEVAPSSFHVLLLSMAAPAKCGRPAWTSGGVALFFWDRSILYSNTEYTE
jgi:hypothetical protein